MKTVTVFCACMLLCSNAVMADFNGRDEFFDGSIDPKLWDDHLIIPGIVEDTFVETNGHLHFVSTNDIEARAFLPWKALAPFGQDWEIAMLATVPDFENTSEQQYSMSFMLTPHNVNHALSNRLAFAMARDESNSKMYFENYVTNSIEIHDLVAARANNTAALRIRWVAATSNLYTDVSEDGGETWVTLWAPVNNPFSMGIGDYFSCQIGGGSAGRAISIADNLYCDVFQAISIPAYAFNVDSFLVVGNLPGNVVEEFDNGVLYPWRVDNGVASEHDGVVTISTPGDGGLLHTNNYFLSTASSEIDSHTGATGLEVADGEGDFTATSAWIETLPAQDQRYYMYADTTVTPEGDDLTRISIGIFNIGPLLAEYFGVQKGIYVVLNDEEIYDLSAVQAVPISIDDVTGSILFSLSYDDETDQFTGTYSLDGGSTFLSPFSPINSGIGAGVFSDWGLHAEALHVRYVVNPAIFQAIIVSNQTTHLSISNLTINASTTLERSFDLTDSNGWHTATSFISSTPLTNISDVISNTWQRAYYRIKSQ